MIREYRTVEEIASPLMIVRMVDGVTYDELVEVELHDGSVRRGQVLEVNGDTRKTSCPMAMAAACHTASQNSTAPARRSSVL